MIEEGSHQEARRISEELAREREWRVSPDALELATLAAEAFDLVHATEAWASRLAEGWIATNDVPVTIEHIRQLTSRVAQITQAVNADLC